MSRTRIAIVLAAVLALATTQALRANRPQRFSFLARYSPAPSAATKSARRALSTSNK